MRTDAKTPTRSSSAADAPDAAKRQSPPSDGNTQKNPRDWVTGGEPMTGAQKSYLHTLSQETGVDVPADLNKGQASEKIDELKQIDPRISGK